MGKGRKTLVLVIAKLRKKYTLKALLNYTKLAKSTYYDALKKLSREDKYKGLKTLIHNICNKNHGRYGYRRVTMQLHKQGIKINHKVVMMLSDEPDIKVYAGALGVRMLGANGKPAPESIRFVFPYFAC